MSTQSLNVTTTRAVLLLDDVPAGALVTNFTTGTTIWLGDDSALAPGNGVKLAAGVVMTTGARGPLFACLDTGSPTCTVVVSTAGASLSGNQQAPSTVQSTQIFGAATFQRAGTDAPLIFDVHTYPSLALRLNGDGSHNVSGWFGSWLDLNGKVIGSVRLSSAIASSQSFGGWLLRTKGYYLALYVNGTGPTVGFGGINLYGNATALQGQDDVIAETVNASNDVSTAPVTLPTVAGKSFNVAHGIGTGNVSDIYSMAASMGGGAQITNIGGRYLIAATWDNRALFAFGMVFGDNVLGNLPGFGTSGGGSGNFPLFTSKDPRRSIGVSADGFTDMLCIETDIPHMVAQSRVIGSPLDQGSLALHLYTPAAVAANFGANFIHLGNGCY